MGIDAAQRTAPNELLKPYSSLAGIGQPRPRCVPAPLP